MKIYQSTLNLNSVIFIRSYELAPEIFKPAVGPQLHIQYHSLSLYKEFLGEGNYRGPCPLDLTLSVRAFSEYKGALQAF